MKWFRFLIKNSFSISGIIFFGILIFGPFIALLFNIPEVSTLVEKHLLLIYHTVGILLLFPLLLIILKILFEKKISKNSVVVDSSEGDVCDFEIESDDYFFCFFLPAKRKKYLFGSIAMSLATSFVIFILLIHIDEILFFRYMDSQWPTIIAVLLGIIYYPLNKKYLE